MHKLGSREIGNVVHTYLHRGIYISVLFILYRTNDHDVLFACVHFYHSFTQSNIEKGKFFGEIDICNLCFNWTPSDI